MVKKALSVKMEPVEIEELKKYAADQGLTVTDLFLSGLKGRQREDHLKEKIRSMEKEMQELRQ